MIEFLNLKKFSQKIKPGFGKKMFEKKKIVVFRNFQTKIMTLSGVNYITKVM